MKTWFGEAPTLFACVHVPEFAAQALLRLRPSLRGRQVAVLEGAAPFERVCAANTLARRDGLVNGMTRVEAESFAGVTLLRRSRREEEAARTALLVCARSFAPRVESCRSDTAAVCVLDAAGLAQLHRDPQTFAEALRCALQSRGLYASIAISANFDAACTLAQGRPEITIAAPGEEQKMLAPLLLEVLGPDEEQAETLALWGIRTLGGVAALPQKELIARMGQGGKRLRELARGEARHLFAPVPVPWELREEFAFENPVRLLEAILFVLSPMLDQLVLQGRERALAIATVTVTFTVAAGETDELDTDENGRTDPVASAGSGAVSAPRSEPLQRVFKRTVRPSLPTQNKRLLLKLLQLDLAAYPLEAPVLAVVLEAEAAKAGAVQNGLFAPPLPEPSRLDVTLAALVSEDRVGSPILRDSHAPDSFSQSGFELANPEREPVEPSGLRKGRKQARAMRKLRPPEPVHVHAEEGQPVRFWFRGELFRVRSACGPWRLNGAWWSNAAWAYEYWDVAAERSRPETAPRAQINPVQPALYPFLVHAPAPEPPHCLCCRLQHHLGPNPSHEWCVEGRYD